MPDSSILLDWPVEQIVQDAEKKYNSSNGEEKVLQVWYEYSPPKGQPTSPVILNHRMQPVAVNYTWAAVGYDVRLMALLRNGTRQILSRKIVYSSEFVR